MTVYSVLYELEIEGLEGETPEDIVNSLNEFFKQEGEWYGIMSFRPTRIVELVEKEI